MVTKLLLAIAILAGGCAAVRSTRGPADAVVVLKRQTQELLDAVTAGDARVWDRYLDPGVVYVSEAGVRQTKADLLAEIKPLPAGISGSLAISRFEVELFDDTAVVVHVDDETENYFGQTITAQYLCTATWRLSSDGWRMISQQVHAMLVDPPAIALPSEQLDDYVGTYRLTDEITYTIQRDGDHLIGERTGRPPQPLRAEARDVWFVPGQPRSRKVFRRDAHGRVNGFADRREARDIVWMRDSSPRAP